MSTSVDERIVRMSFDNAGFERGVSSTLGFLEKLNQGLKLKGATNGLNEVDRGIKGLTMGGLGGLSQGVDGVSNRFSAMSVVAITALMRITETAVDSGRRLVKSFSLDPIIDGFGEYETKMNSIQTILTNTRSKGTTLSEVNDALGELNEYSDKTIYNFAQMTDNIGKATAAGVGLKDSVTFVKGMSNAAAGFGVDATRMAGATYQMTQALATGVVRLQDWNSLQQAGMGGEPMQQEMLKVAKGMGKVVDTSKGFRESLQQNWLTSDVFLKAMENMANDPSLTAAATNVTSFTKLLDTMKESIGSGWAVSFENIFGNKDQSTKLWTDISNAFSKIVGASADARNKMLGEWNKGGGRDAVIKGLTNIVQSIGKGISAIRDAFRDIFPPMTGKKLIEISKGFLDLTEKFKMSDKTAGAIKSTFKGLFSVLNLGKNAILVVVKALSPLAGIFGGIGKVVLSVTSAIGKFISGINDAATKSGFFDNLSGTINKALNSMGNFAGKAGDFIGDIFSKIKYMDFGPAFQMISEGIKGLGEGISTILDGLGKAFGSFNINNLLQVINTLLTGKAIIMIKDTISNLSDTTEKVTGVFDQVTGVLDSVSESIQTMTANVKADVLLKISAAIGLLAASLAILASIDPERLESALTGITVLFIELGLTLKALLVLAAGQKLKGFFGLQTFFVTFAAAITILATAVKKLADIDTNRLIGGLAGVAALMTMCVLTAKYMNTESKGMIKTATSMLIMGAAINVLASAVQRLSAVNPEEMGQGLIGVATLLGELLIFQKLMKVNKDAIKTSTSLLIMSAAVAVLSQSVQTFADIDTNKLVQSLAAVGVILVELAAFSKIAGKGEGSLISSSAGLVVFGVALNILSQSVAHMANLSWEQLAIGLTGIAGALLSVGLASKVIPDTIAADAVGVGLMAGALVILAAALRSMGGMEPQQLAIGLTALSASLVVIALAMGMMTEGLAGAAAMLVMAGALAIFTPQLILLGQLSMEQVGVGLMALAGAFMVLGVAAATLTPALPAMLGLAGCIALFGASALAVGLGMSAFATGLALVATVGVAGGFALAEVFRQLINLLPQLGTKLGEGLTNLATAIGQGMPQITVAIGQMITGVIQGFTQAIPQIATAATELITALLKVLGDAIPKLVTIGVNVVVKIAEGIAKNVGKLATAAVNIIVTIINTISKNMGRIINAGINLAINFINGVANGLDKNAPRMASALGRLIQSVMKAGLTLLKGAVGGFISGGLSLIKGVIQGVDQMSGGFISKVGALPGKALNGIRGAVGQFVSMGSQLIRGLTNGIKNAASGVVNAAKSVVNGAINKAKALLGIHSPSRVFMGIGRYTVMGFANGLKRNRDMVVEPAENLAKRAIDATSGPLSQLAKALTMDIESDPKIRPVIDISNVKKGVGEINKLVTSVEDFKFSAQGTGILAGSIGKVQNGVSNSEVVNAINDLKDNLPQPSGDSYSINGITYDDGTNVSNAVKTLVHAAKIERRV